MTTLFFKSIERSGADLLSRATRLAGGLRALGLQEGAVIAVLMRNNPQYADVIGACRIAGISYCPINWHFTPEEVKFLVTDSGATALLGDGDLIDAVLPALPPDLPLLAVGPALSADAQNYETWLAAQPAFAGPAVSPRAHVAYTSGTTGRPKGVIRQPIPLAELPARQAVIQRVIEATFGIRPGCRALIPAPLYHSAPTLFMQSALQQAETTVLMDRFDPETLLALIERHRIDTVYLVPIMYVRLLRLPETIRGRYDISSLRFVASTGAPCAPDVKAKMIAWFGPVIHETYASSETGMITAISSTEALARPGSAGRPVGDAKIAIYSESGTKLKNGEIGLIHFNQPAWPDFTYRGNAAARRAIERDGLVGLGDIGYLDGDGYLYVCDRASDMVISGGVNIYPAETEHRLLMSPDVADCAVFGIPDPEYGERLHAVIELAHGATFSELQLIAWMKTGLAAYKVPRTVEIAPLPRDDNGKIAKRRLREAYWAGQQRRV
jgi:long-chain acyl-CoA synthetase